MPVYYYRDNITPGDKSELRGIAEEAAKIVESVADPVNLLRGKKNGGFKVKVVHVRV